MLHVIADLQSYAVVGNRTIYDIVAVHGNTAVFIAAVGENKFCPFFTIIVETFYIER